MSNTKDTASNTGSMSEKRIAIFYSDRSEYGLLEPLIRELRAVPEFVVCLGDMRNMFANIDDDILLGHLYKIVYSFLDVKTIDFAFCPFDRREVMFAALACFLHGTPFATLHSGDVGTVDGSWDHIFRHQIMLMSTLQFCNDRSSFENAKTILNSIGKSTKCCYNVGSTAFDDMDMEKIESVPLPDEPFNLVVLHPNNTSEHETETDIREIKKFISNNPIRTVILNPNRDRFRELIHETWEWMERNLDIISYYPDGVSRIEFFALMKRCNKMIGNSSSFLLEAPVFKNNEDIILVGKRNLGRERIESPEIGGARRVVEIVVKELLGDK